MGTRKLVGLVIAGVFGLSTGCDNGSDEVLLTDPADDDGEEGAGETAATEESGGDTMDSGPPMTVTPKRCLELIDGMEEGTNLIPVEGGRQGAWYTFNDESEGGMQTPEGAFVPAAGGSPNSDASIPETLGAARTSGTGFVDWGAGIGVNLNDPGCAEVDDAGECIGEASIPMNYDASGFTGVSYYVRYWGDLPGAPISFKVVTEGVTLEVDGGTCVVVDGAQCEIAHQTSKPAYDGLWRAYEIPFSDLIQPSYAGTNLIPFDPTTVRSLQWQVTQIVPVFDFAIDEVCFY